MYVADLHMEQLSKRNTFLFVTPKSWHDSLFQDLQQSVTGKWIRIFEPNEFTADQLDGLDPELIFLPHWSHIIPETIYERYTCIVFHMTDLPYGRGGSPLQNLILRKHKTTVISAIKVEKGIDSGPVYLKSRPISLEGTAEDIFKRCSVEIGKMIRSIIQEMPSPQPQTGEITHFKRRKPDDSNIASLSALEDIYDHIRMLDCEGYPPAFIETNSLRIEFDQAAFADNQTLTAHVRIIKK